MAGNCCFVPASFCQAGMGGNIGFVLPHRLGFPREPGYMDFYVESPDF